MSVPDTNSFRLTNVTTEVYGSNLIDMSLRSCFDDASGTFDSSYEGSKNRLLNFRNYIHSNPNTPVILTLNAINVQYPDFTPQSTPTVRFMRHTINDQGDSITECGFYYATHDNPTASDTKITGSSCNTHLNILHDVSNLSFNTRYYYRAFATNSYGTGLGVIKSIVTQNNCTILEAIHRNITDKEADIGYKVLKVYRSVQTINQAIIYLDTQNPPRMDNDHKYFIGQQSVTPSNEDDEYLFEMTEGTSNELTPNTTYYYTISMWSDESCKDGDNPSCWDIECVGIKSFTTNS